MYQEIFKQGKIGNITLKNRLVMSPMGTSLAEMDGSPSEDMIAFYKARAIGGAALIIPEIARVNDLHGAGMMRLFQKTDISKVLQSLQKQYINMGQRYSSSCITLDVKQ